MTAPDPHPSAHQDGEATASATALDVARLAVQVEAALDAQDWHRAAAAVAALRAADLADLLQELTPDDREHLIGLIRDGFEPETLVHLDETVREDVVEQLGSADVAAALSELETDEAIEVIVELDEADRAEILQQLSPSDRAILETALSYPEDSAGRLMQREIVTVPANWRVGDTIDYMRARAAQLPRDFCDIFVVDDERHPVGVLPLSRLMRSLRPVEVSDIMQRSFHSIFLTVDQEDVAHLFRQYGLVSAPVVDEEGQLVGVITVDDVVDVIQEEAEEDIMHLGSVHEDDFYAALFDTTRARFSWLFVNLGRATVASVVIGLFDAVIERVVALAVLMPIVASMGGNAGTQTLTVAVRALAMKELTPTNAARIIVKEVLVGGINGILFAIVMGLLVWLWFGDPALGAIIASAMIINLVIAGLAGTVVPIALDRMRVDPAIASTVVLTTVTDVVGFLSFLGLGALVLL